MIAVAILLDSGRPVFFRQRRAGKDGKPFTMLKFRTMVTDAEERLGELVDLEKLERAGLQDPRRPAGDPRRARPAPHQPRRAAAADQRPARPTCRWSGPRPEEEAVVALYDERQRVRLAVKPGLTGPMQVYGRSDLTFEERLAMERDYLDNLSIDRRPGDPAAHAGRDRPRRRGLLSDARHRDQARAGRS